MLLALLKKKNNGLKKKRKKKKKNVKKCKKEVARRNKKSNGSTKTGITTVSTRCKSPKYIKKIPIKIKKKSNDSANEIKKKKNNNTNEGRLLVFSKLKKKEKKDSELKKVNAGKIPDSPIKLCTEVKKLKRTPIKKKKKSHNALAVVLKLK